MRTFERTASRTSVRTFDRTESGALPPVVSDPDFEYTTLLLPGNGTNGAQNNTFLDGSTNNFTITRNGNTTQGTFSPFSQTGWSNYFDGTSGQYLNTVANTAFNFGTGDFTVEAWVYPTGTNAGAPMPIFEIRTSAANTTGFAFMRPANALTLNVFTNSGYVGASTNSLVFNFWNHVALTRSGNTWTYWINGVSSGSFTNSSTQSDGGTTGPKIGGSTTAGEVWIGYISNARIVKGTAVYTTNFTPSTTPLTAISGTSLLTCQSNRFSDNSSNAFAITVNGSPSVQAFSPFNPTAAWSAATNGGSGYFDGSGDYLSGPANSAFAFGTGNFTVEGWTYSVNASTYVLIDFRNANPSATGFGLAINPNGAFFVYSSATVITGGTVPNSQWNHLVYVRSGTTHSIYVNGSRVATGTNSTNWTDNNSDIGTNTAGNVDLINGYISGLRVVKGTAVYDPTQSTLTVPTAPPTAVSGTSLLTNFTNAGIYDATSKNDLETVGNAQISTTQSKFGGSSMYFDGTGDYLSAKNNPALQLGSGDFTVEFWLYANSSSANHGLVASDQTGSGYWAILIASNTIYWQNVNGSSNLFSTSYSSYYNQWVHVAFVRYSGTTKLYLNGAYIAGAADSSNYNGAAGAYDVGRDVDNGAYLTGYINDLRVTKGIARYTSNFTPPTTAFPVL